MISYIDRLKLISVKYYYYGWPLRSLHNVHFFVDLGTDDLFIMPTSFVADLINFEPCLICVGGFLALDDLVDIIGRGGLVLFITGRVPLADGFLTKAFIISLNSYLDIYPSLFLSNYLSKLLYCYYVTLSTNFSLIY